MTRLAVTFVETFAPRPLRGATVAVVHGDPGVEARAVAGALGAAATVFVTSPRRDDCDRRLRTFVARREVPLSAKGALAAAEALRTGDRVAFEQGVTRTVVERDAAAGAWTLPLARPVLGSLALHDRALAAAALGLAEGDLVEGLPALSASCGLLSLLVPVASGEALGRAAIQPALWQRLVEKAKPFGAAAFVPSGEGAVALRCLVPGAGDDVGAGLACASAAAYLVRHGARAPGPGRVIAFEQPGDGERVARVRVTVDGLGDRDGAVRVTGECALAGEGWLESGP